MKPNFDSKKEEAEQLGNEWQFGSFSQPAIITIPITERNLWLPTGENQFDQITDFQDCASRSPVNHLEMLFSYHYAHNMQAGNKMWLEQNGYIVNGKVTFSKRFIATLSGTTHTGNSLKAPLDAIRKQGLIPESLLPQSDAMTWDDYYQIVPQNLIDLGKEFLTRFSVNYEQVNQVHFPDLLMDDMIGVAGHAWNDPVNGVYEKTSDPINHAFLLYSIPDYQVVDNYTPYTKTISPDYTFYAYGYRVYISSETTPELVTENNIISVWLAKMVAWIMGGSKPPMPAIPSEILPTPILPVPIPSMPPHQSKITPWALAIQHAEGGKPQDLNTRLHNPGNLKFSPYTASLGGKKSTPGTDGGNFCVFDTYDQGFKALCQFLTDAASDRLVIGHGLTLDQFTTKYAQPPSKAYVNSVALALGVPTSIKIKELL